MPSWQFSGVLARGGAPSGNISQTQTPLAVFAGLSQSFFFPAAANSQPRFAGRALRLPGLDHSVWKYDLAICGGGPVDSVESSTVSAVDTWSRHGVLFYLLPLIPVQNDNVTYVSMKR